MTTSAQTAQTVDMDHLVVEMIRHGAGNVSRPDGMADGDFVQIQKVVHGMSGLYPESAITLVRTKNDQDLGGKNMIELLESGDYQEAFDYLVFVADFIPV
ncbi:MAG: hypothetical protein OXM62_06015 [bacterium]|nr:hypothetical protein [bacterium]MDE0234544.1 hypothetical protein [bacterium]